MSRTKRRASRSHDDAKTAGQYGLKYGHPTEFRRTVTIGEGDSAQRVQLVFQPNAPLELSDEEIAGLKKEIDGGLIVPWVEDEKGRRKPNSPAPLNESTKRPAEGIAPVDIEHKGSADDSASE